MRISIAIIAGGIFAFLSPSAYAATAIYFDTPVNPVSVGTPFSVVVSIDSDQPLNAYSLALHYEGAALGLVNVDTTHSVVTISTGDPKVTSGGNVAWRGGSLMPFTGIGGKIFTLNLVANATGTAKFSFTDASVYLANGKGTKEIPEEKKLNLAVESEPLGNASSPGVAITTAADVIPPEIRSLSFTPDPFNQNQKFVAFLVSDDGSGIGMNELRYRIGFFWSGWQEVKNPVPLANGVWEADFRSTDRAGNVAERTIYDWTTFWWFVLETAAGGAVIVAAITLFIARRRKAL